IAMVFQSYALYPHLSVYENIAFGLRIKKVPKQEIERRVQEAAKILDLEPYLKRKPRALSGGQRQRVAMGRAIVREPAAFLMDELQQVADPQTLYDRPVNLFVGGFIGSPAMNMIEATLERRNGGFAVKVGAESISLDDETLAAHPALPDYEGRDVVLGIRPED